MEPKASIEKQFSCQNIQLYVSLVSVLYFPEARGWPFILAIKLSNKDTKRCRQLQADADRHILMQTGTSRCRQAQLDAYRQTQIDADRNRYMQTDTF